MSLAVEALGTRTLQPVSRTTRLLSLARSNICSGSNAMRPGMGNSFVSFIMLEKIESLLAWTMLSSGTTNSCKLYQSRRWIRHYFNDPIN